MLAGRQENSPVDCFAGGSREANPLTSTKNNLTEGLKLLETVIRYQRKYSSNQTKSVFLWYTSGKSLIGYEKRLERLFRQKEFALGLRYAVISHIPTKTENKRLESFTENSERILNYFSPNRLLRLATDLAHK